MAFGGKYDAKSRLRVRMMRWKLLDPPRFTVRRTIKALFLFSLVREPQPPNNPRCNRWGTRMIPRTSHLHCPDQEERSTCHDPPSCLAMGPGSPQPRTLCLLRAPCPSPVAVPWQGGAGLHGATARWTPIRLGQGSATLRGQSPGWGPGRQRTDSCESNSSPKSRERWTPGHSLGGGG